MDSQENQKLTICSAEYDCSCCVTQQSIEKGETALQIKGDPVAWVSREGIRKIHEVFSSHTQKENDLQGLLPERDNNATGTCLICEKQKQSGTEVLIMGFFFQIWIHKDCTEEFAKLVREEVEESAAEFL